MLDLDAGRFHVAGAPQPALSWAELASRLQGRGPARASSASSTTSTPALRRSRSARTSRWSRSTPRPAGSSSAASSRSTTPGTIINPLVAEGQVHGGVATGIAQALYEEFIYDEDGNPLTASFAGYCFPSAADLPSFERVADGDADAASTRSGRRASASPGRSAPRPRCTTPSSTRSRRSASATSTCPSTASRSGGRSRRTAVSQLGRGRALAGAARLPASGRQTVKPGQRCRRPRCAPGSRSERLPGLKRQAGLGEAFGEAELEAERVGGVGRAVGRRVAQCEGRVRVALVAGGG